MKALNIYLLFCLCVACAITLIVLLNYLASYNNNFVFTVEANTLGEGWLETILLITSLPGITYIIYNKAKEIGTQFKTTNTVKDTGVLFSE